MKELTPQQKEREQTECRDCFHASVTFIFNTKEYFCSHLQMVVGAHESCNAHMTRCAKEAHNDNDD